MSIKHLDLFESLEPNIKNKKLVLEGREYTLAQFKKEAVTLLPHTEETGPFILLAATKAGEFKDVCENIYNELYQRANIAASPLASEYFLDSFSMEGFGIVIDILTGKEHVVNLKTMALTNIQPRAYWAFFPDKLAKQMKDTQATPVVTCVFDPTSNETSSKVGDMTRLNIYQAPVWTNKTASGANPKDFKDFMNHLFMKNKQQIHVAMAWMYRLIFNIRNGTGLVLNGIPGAGKNTFYNICMAAVGMQYSLTVTKGFGRKEFNSEFRNRLLILFDEHRVDKDKHRFIKQAFNRFQNIEAKGQDTGVTEEVYGNFMFFHNNVADMYLEPDERKFTVLDICKVKLEEAWGRPRATSFNEDILDPDSQTLADICLYIKDYCEKNLPPEMITSAGAHTNFLGEKFNEFMECHLSPTLKAAISLIEKEKYDADELTLEGADINKAAAKMTGKNLGTQGYRMESLVGTYRYEGKYILGEVFKAAPWHLKINPKLVKHLKDKS